MKILIFLSIVILIMGMSLYSALVIFRAQVEPPRDIVDGPRSDAGGDLLSLIRDKIPIDSFNEYLWPIIFRPEDVECRAYTVMDYNLSDIEYVLDQASERYMDSWRRAWMDGDVTTLLLLSDMSVSIVEVKFGLSALKVNDIRKAVESYTYGCIVNYRLENLNVYREKVESIIGLPSLSITFFEEVRAKLSERVGDVDTLLNFKEASLNYFYLLSLEFDDISDVRLLSRCDIESTMDRVMDFIESIYGDPYLKAVYYDLIYYIFRELLVDKYVLSNDVELVQVYLCYLLSNLEDVFGVGLYVVA